MKREFIAHSMPAPSKRNQQPKDVDHKLENAHLEQQDQSEQAQQPQREIGGPAGPEPTRYGDWEIGGIARDF